MGVIKRADLEAYTRDAVPLDLRDVTRRADEIMLAAQTQARKIIEDAQAERDRILEDGVDIALENGRKDGLAQGLKLGKDEGREQAQQEHAAKLEAIENAWIESLQSWEASRAALMSAAKSEVVELAAHMAARVLKRTIELDPEVVVDQLESILETLIIPTDLRIHAHPDDMELLKRSIPTLIDRFVNCTRAELVEDESLAPGSCVATTQGGGGIDASIKSQLDRVIAAIMPAHRGPDYDELIDEPDIESHPREDPSQSDDEEQAA